MSLTGDFAALASLARRFHQVGREMPLIARDMRAEVVRKNRASFAGQTSPEGDAWADGPYVSSPKLRRSGKTANLKPAGAGLSFGVRAGTRYAFYHQHGANLRDSIVGSAGKLRSRAVGPGRGRSGPRQKIKPIGPQRKGRLRGFLPARPIVPRGDIPTPWVAPLVQIADRRIRRALGF